jgi:hypothetical protein
MEKFRIGYFVSLKLEEQYIGGVMVTDSSAIPLEFKYTEPIHPTRIHQILFGKVLHRYLTDEVIRKSLLKEVRNVPLVYFVRDLELLGEDTQNKVPLVAVQKTSLPALAAIGETQRVKDKELVIQSASLPNPLRLVFFTAELDVQEKMLGIVKTCLEKMDVLEPFERIENALQALCQGKG